MNACKLSLLTKASNYSVLLVKVKREINHLEFGVVVREFYSGEDMAFISRFLDVKI